MASRKAALNGSLSDEQFHAISRALSDPRRFAILEQVASAPVTPCSALHEQENVSPATISHHVKELADAGLLLCERDGRYMNLSVQRTVWSAYLKRLASL